MKLSILFTILLFCISIEMLACFGARQTRLLPIGVLGNDVVALQLVMHRGHDIPDTAKIKDDNMPWWHGRARLVRFETQSFTIKEIRYNIPISTAENQMESQVNTWYNNALKAAKSIPDITLLTPESISICNFRPDCSIASFTFNQDSSQLYAQYKPTGKGYNVSELTFVDSNTVIFYPGAHAEETAYPTVMLQNKITPFEIGSIRVFSIGDRKLMVLHIGFGDRPELEDGSYEEAEPEYTPKHPKFDKIKNCAYDETILHHGTSLDLPIWLN